MSTAIKTATNRSHAIARWEEISPNKLLAASRLTRKHSSSKKRSLLASIETNGIITPVVVNSASVIVDGHLRVECAKKLGLRSVPIVRVEHLTDAELRAFAIAANKMPGDITWDVAELRLELEDIKALDIELDLTLTGFSIGEIDRINGNHLFDQYNDLEDTAPPDPEVDTPRGACQSKRTDWWLVR